MITLLVHVVHSHLASVIHRTYTHTHTHTHTHTAYHQLMLHTDTNEENLSGFLKLLDMALQHEVNFLVHVRAIVSTGCENSLVGCLSFSPHSSLV